MRNRLAVAALFCLMFVGAEGLASAASIKSKTYLYQGPGYGYAALLTLPRGASIGLGACQGSWCAASHVGRSGWVHQSFVTGAVSGATGPGNSAIILRKRSGGSGLSSFGVGTFIRGVNRSRRGGGQLNNREAIGNNDFVEN